MTLSVKTQFDLSAEDLAKAERLGYFAPWPAVAGRRRLDPDTKPGKLIFNRTITLKDAWAKIEGKRA